MRDICFATSETTNPTESMYGIFTYIYHKNQPNVGKYTIHGLFENGKSVVWNGALDSRVPLGIPIPFIRGSGRNPNHQTKPTIYPFMKKIGWFLLY